MSASNILKYSKKKKNIRISKYYPRYWFMTDISNAYGSVDFEKLVLVLYPYLKDDMDIESSRLFLERHCISPDGGLVVGAPLSPLFFNIYCEKLIDSQLREYCDKNYVTYTRYLDDLTFSADRPIGKIKRRKMLSLVRAADFTINNRKTHLGDLWKKSIEINGIGLRKQGSKYVIFLPRHYLNHIRGLLNLVLKRKIKISPHVINGKMGLFLSLTKGRSLNRTEMKVLEMYKQFKEIEQLKKS